MNRRDLRRATLALSIPMLLLLSGANRPCGGLKLSKVPDGYTVLEDRCASTGPKFHEVVRPLADLIAKGEGDYNAVNRGYAGDTPQGIKGLTGSSFAAFTVGEVIDMQKNWLYAVGRYQFIPKTLRFAVNVSEVRLTDKFTNETQDKLFAALLDHKRPSVGAYIRGHHDFLGWALDDLAREWASVEFRRGRGYYDHIGGNRAHISRAEAAECLKELRASLLNK